MSNHHRFKLSHLMPNSWFYKLRDMKRSRPPSSQRSSIETARTSKRPPSHYYHGTTTPKPLPLSPHRSYHYLSTKQMSLEKIRPSTLHVHPKASDIHFPSRDHHHHQGHQQLQTSMMRPNAIVAEAAAAADELFQDLQLRPIRTRPAAAGSASGTCPSSPRLRSRSRLVNAQGSGGRLSAASGAASGGRRRSVARRSFAVVKESTDPPRDFRESMVEMIAQNGVHAPEEMQELLECYLSLNSREYHGVITDVFREIWLEISQDTAEDRGDD